MGKARCMARPLRIEYAGAIYHVMSRGNARQIIFLDDKDREKMLKDLEDSVVRYGWEMFSFCLMPNHFHVFFHLYGHSLAVGLHRYGQAVPYENKGNHT